MKVLYELISLKHGVIQVTGNPGDNNIALSNED